LEREFGGGLVRGAGCEVWGSGCGDPVARCWKLLNKFSC